jgi:hypothetical protein
MSKEEKNFKLTCNDLLLLPPPVTCQPIEFVLSPQRLGSCQDTPARIRDKAVTGWIPREDRRLRDTYASCQDSTSGRKKCRCSCQLSGFQYQRGRYRDTAASRKDSNAKEKKLYIRLSAPRIPPSGRIIETATNCQDCPVKEEELKKRYPVPGFLLQEEFEKQLPTARIALQR